MDIQSRRRVAGRILLMAGVAISATIYIWGGAKNRRVERTIAALKLACETEGAREVAERQKKENEFTEWAQKHPASESVADRAESPAPPLPPDWEYGESGIKLSSLINALRKQQLLRICDPDVLWKSAAFEPTQGERFEVVHLDGTREVIDAGDLKKRIGGITATQTEMIHLHEERTFGWYREPLLVPGVVAILFAIPWLWYFALDRLRELSAAIQGKSG